jgi:SAM-dependent methyltransferase
MELLPLFEGYTQFVALDLGSGVGRNSIPVAQHFSGIPCRVDCVDILELAITKLNENTQKYGAVNSIRGIVSAIDDYEITADSYDLVMAISALEHIASQSAFEKKLNEIRDGLRHGGIACLIVNSGVVEHDKATGQELPPQFEVNLPTSQMRELLEKTFAGWQVIKHTIVHQKYDIPRENCITNLETDVVTYVVRKG